MQLMSFSSVCSLDHMQDQIPSCDGSVFLSADSHVALQPLAFYSVVGKLVIRGVADEAAPPLSWRWIAGTSLSFNTLIVFMVNDDEQGLILNQNDSADMKNDDFSFRTLLPFVQCLYVFY